MSDQTSKIAAAIHECLDACYAAQWPIACMNGFIEQLRRDPEWAEAEINVVEQRVRQTLALSVDTPLAARISA